MTTPSRTPSRAEMYPTDPHSGQRISLSLSDLVSPGLKEFDDLETDTKTSVSGNDATNYKKELKKLLAKSRGTAYEATLRRFVEQKYNEIKKDEASNRKLFGHSRGAIAGSTPSIASLSRSKYDNTASAAALREANIYGVASTYQDGRIVETNFDTLGSRPSSPRSSKVPPPPPPQSKPAYAHGNSLGYSILNESVNLGVTFNNKSRIDEMSKPVERNVYKGPTPPSPFGSTNHLGRQRPPPPPSPRGVSRSPDRRAPSSSPYASPYRQRKAAEQAAAAEEEANQAYPDLFQSLAHTAAILPQGGAKSYEEFRQWLGNNRDWMRKRTNKVQSKQAAVMKDTTHDFTPQIIPKSKKLAEAANKRAFQRLAADHSQSQGQSQGHLHNTHGDNVSVDGLSENGLAFVLGSATKVSLHRGHSRSRSRSPRQSRSRSPISPQMRSFAPTPLPYPETIEIKPATKVRGDSIASTDTAHTAHSALPPKQRLSTTSVVSQATHASSGPLHTQHKARAGSAQPTRSKMEHDELSVTSAPVHSHTNIAQAPHTHSGVSGAGSSRSVAPPTDVFERLAVRGRLQAHKTYNWDLPPPQDTYAPKISERSLRLAEKKHQRDLTVGSRARSVSLDRSARRPPQQSAYQEDNADPQYLERNYDYYELYTMPERYMYRVAHPEQYKVSGTVPRNNIRNADEKLLLEVSGLSKVTRARQERALRSASPAHRTSVAGSTSVSTSTGVASGIRAPAQESALNTRQNTQLNTQQNSQQNTPAGSILRTSSTDGAMHMNELLGGLNIHTAFELNAPQPNVLHSTLPVHADDGGKYYTHESPRGGRNVSRSPKPRAHSPTYSPGRDDRSVELAKHAKQAVKEGIQQSRALSKSKREAEKQEFNRRHYLSKETKEAKPFQPLLLATETHRIMSRVNSSFEDRTNKSVETLYVRREVARRFPSPGPGRYTSGIAVDKIVQSLSVGSPQKLSRSRSMSPAPGHRGFSFSKEPLGRFIDPGADPASGGVGGGNGNGTGGGGAFSPNATGNGIGGLGMTGGSHR